MRRREFITLIGSAVTWPLMASAQQTTPPVFGILLVFSQEAGRIFTEPLRAYMQALGYVEGRNTSFDVRYADGKVDRLPALAFETDLVRFLKRGDAGQVRAQGGHDLCAGHRAAP